MEMENPIFPFLISRNLTLSSNVDFTVPTTPLILILFFLSFFMHSPFSISISISISIPTFSSHHLSPSFSLSRMAAALPCLLSFFLPILLSFSLALSTNSEGNALHALRSRLSDPTNVLQSWDPTLVNPCTWFHVTCDSNNHVVRLDLGNSNISGSLGPELGELKHLQYLELYKNNLVGKIPKELGNLGKLISMDLYENKFQGRIPKSFANLKSLRFLRLNDNKLSGSIPRELTTLTDLKVFDVSNNDLCGTIPVDGPFGTFPMESFANNRLNGPELKGLVPYDFGC